MTSLFTDVSPNPTDVDTARCSLWFGAELSIVRHRSSGNVLT